MECQVGFCADYSLAQGKTSREQPSDLETDYRAVALGTSQVSDYIDYQTKYTADSQYSFSGDTKK